MRIEFDPAKRDKTLAERGLDFERAPELFAGLAKTRRDTRNDYGEVRNITFGWLDEHAVVMVWTPRGAVRRIISMRYANEREKARYSSRMG